MCTITKTTQQKRALFFQFVFLLVLVMLFLHSLYVHQWCLYRRMSLRRATTFVIKCASQRRSVVQFSTTPTFEIKSEKFQVIQISA
jgi:hypothetical protein